MGSIEGSGDPQGSRCKTRIRKGARMSVVKLVDQAEGSRGHTEAVEVELINKMIDALLVAGYGLREARWFSTCGMKYLIDLKAGVMLRRGEAEDG